MSSKQQTGHPPSHPPSHAPSQPGTCCVFCLDENENGMWYKNDILFHHWKEGEEKEKGNEQRKKSNSKKERRIATTATRNKPSSSPSIKTRLVDIGRRS